MALPGRTILVLVLLMLVCLGAYEGGRTHETNYRIRSSRAKREMRELAHSIGAFRSAQGAYPPMLPIAASGVSEKKLSAVQAIGLSSIDPGGTGRIGLTAPVAYISLIPTDASNTTAKMPYAYWTGEDRYLIFSTGPDGRFTIRHPEEALAGDGKGGVEIRDPDLVYDPSNGTTSEGDIVLFGASAPD